MVKKSLYLTLSLLSIIILINNAFAEQFKSLKDEAVKYRLEGLAYQQKGDFDRAMEYFQKAISLDPAYAIAHNDIGIIYEEKGWLERAESEYLEALKIDANYLPAYGNLAMLYEIKGDIDKAIYYWRQRAALGLIDDPWTIKAQENLKRLNAPLLEPVIVSQETGMAVEREMLDEADTLLKSVTLSKQMESQQRETEFIELKTRGQGFYDEGKYDSALEQFRKARSINPQDQEINLLIEDSEAKFVENLMNEYFSNGLRYYQQRDLVHAQDEFRKILNVMSTLIGEQEREKKLSTPAQ